jgi:microcystin-dependent protein
MSWTSPGTAVVGQLVTAAYWNQQIRDNLNAVAAVGDLKFKMRAPTAIETVLDGGWLEINAVDVSRTTYSSLWTYLGTTIAAAFTGTTTLNGALNASQTNVTITAWQTTWPSDGRKFLIQVDSEKMLVTAGFGTTALTVTRAAEGTTGATHSNGATVSAPSQSPFGHGDGSTTFTLPDGRSRSLVMAAASGHADVATLAGNDGTTLANRRPKHRHSTSHTLTLPDHVHGDQDGNPALVQSGDAGMSSANVTTGGGGYRLGNSGNPTTHPAITGSVTVGAGGSDPLDATPYLVFGVIAVKF